jgi:hypothetical protein
MDYINKIKISHFQALSGTFRHFQPFYPTFSYHITYFGDFQEVIKNPLLS